MEHSIDLSACHFIQEVSPSSMSKLLKKIKKAFEDTDISDMVDPTRLTHTLLALTSWPTKKEKLMRMLPVLISLELTSWTQ